MAFLRGAGRNTGAGVARARLNSADHHRTTSLASGMLKPWGFKEGDDSAVRKNQQPMKAGGDRKASGRSSGLCCGPSVGTSLDGPEKRDDHPGLDEDGKTIRIAAVIIRNRDGYILSVRKKATSAFMLPGGKLEAGERGIEAARREIAEELHMELEASDLLPLGTMRAPAANEPGCTVVCDVFEWNQSLDDAGDAADTVARGAVKVGDDRLAEDGVPATVRVFEEIVEARWFAPHSTSDVLAPLSRDVVFPALRNRG